LAPSSDRARLSDQVGSARHLGAEVVEADGKRAEQTLISVARARGATQIVAPLPTPGPRFRSPCRELRALFERSPGLDLHLLDVTVGTKLP
jgi:hypothetical protein